MDCFLRNKMREKLDAGAPAYGVQLRSDSKRVAELIALSGFDFIYIEGEHYFHDDASLEDYFRAVAPYGCAPIVRLCELSPARVTQVLEMGAMGIIIPHLETREEADAMIQAVKYHPIGSRVSTESRCGGYGLIPAKEVIEKTNHNVMAIAMIESVKAVENLDDILASGIDAIRIGFSDLSADMGYYHQPRHPEVLALAERAVSTAKKHKVPVGTKAVSFEEAQRFMELGFSHFSLTSDMIILKKAFSEMIKEYGIT